MRVIEQSGRRATPVMGGETYVFERRPVRFLVNVTRLTVHVGFYVRAGEARRMASHQWDNAAQMLEG